MHLILHRTDDGGRSLKFSYCKCSLDGWSLYIILNRVCQTGIQVYSFDLNVKFGDFFVIIE